MNLVHRYHHLRMSDKNCPQHSQCALCLFCAVVRPLVEGVSLLQYLLWNLVFKHPNRNTGTTKTPEERCKQYIGVTLRSMTLYPALSKRQGGLKKSINYLQE